ncbi:MAG: hypothetical protein Q9200_006973, partial [Gallowayella weberi]
MQLLSSPLLASLFSFLLANAITAFPTNLSNPLNLTNAGIQRRSLLLSRDAPEDHTNCFNVKERGHHSFSPDDLKSLANELQIGDPDNELNINGGPPKTIGKGTMKACVESLSTHVPKTEVGDALQQIYDKCCAHLTEPHCIGGIYFGDGDSGSKMN